MDYTTFIKDKSQWHTDGGIKPGNLPSYLYDFQAHLVDWALRMGRAAIFADCGLGKTAIQLAWLNYIIEQKNRPGLIVTPLAVGHQTVKEADTFGVSAERTKNGRPTLSPKIYVTNYEQLHKYDPSQYCGVVFDESSAIKDFKSKTKATVIDFSKSIPCRLLCTATAAPNDFWELGTSSEALGYLGFRDMITTFFKQETSSGKGWGRTKYRFRGHAEEPFWSWVCSWARSLRKPSDIGFSDDRFDLPPLHEHEIEVKTEKLRDGMLFALPAVGLAEEREERRLTITERCEKAAEIMVNHDGPSVGWVELNDEGDTLARMVGAKQVTGSMTDDQKEECLIGFSEGEIKHLVTKPKIGAWGLNWQHCSNVVMFPSHSYEQYYQAIRRCYRFGQKSPVHVHLVRSQGEGRLAANLKRKKEQASIMFDRLVHYMHDSLSLATVDRFDHKEEIPSWL